MHKFKRLFNYYLSAYWNNPRTLSSMYSFLKLFFERNNKVDSTVAAFGNVFRNSKWSNLQVQNIKKLFIKQWLGFFVVILFTVIFLFTYSSTSFYATTLNFFYFKQILNDVLTNVYYLLGCFVYQIYLIVNKSFTTNYERTLSTNYPTSQTNVNLLSGGSVLSTASKSSNQNLFLLQKTMNTLYNLTNNTTFQTQAARVQVQAITTTFRNNIYFNTLISSSTKTTTCSADFSENNFVLGSHLNPILNQTLNTVTTLNELYSDKLFTNDPMLTEVLPANLNNIAKQQRWLTRNFWSNQNIVSNSNSVTESKNFIQNPLTNTSLIDTNIWLSNKLTNFETEKSTLLFQKLKTNYDLVTMFNFFENSRFFVNQRYTYFNQLPNQFVTSSIQPMEIINSTPSTLATTTKLQVTKTYLLSDLDFNTSLYHPQNQLFNFIVDSNNQTISTNNLNIFSTNVITDFLQNTDLQSLNTVNTASSSTQNLHLNVNFTQTSYRS